MAYLAEKINANIKIQEHNLSDHENSLKKNTYEDKGTIYALEENKNLIHNKEINKNKSNDLVNNTNKDKENTVNQENMVNEKSDEKMEGNNDKINENENSKSSESLMSNDNASDNLKKDMKDTDTEGKNEDKKEEKEKTQDYSSKKNISIELLKICDALKNIGNKYFKENNYIVSLKYYTESINLVNNFFDGTHEELLKNISLDNLQGAVSVDDADKDLLNEYYINSVVSKKEDFISIKETDLHIYYTNRSFCHMKLENYGSSIQDIDEAVKINPFYAKAYYRKGCSYLLLSDLKNASECFQKVLKLTKDKNSEIKLKQCKKLLFEQSFQKAIELEQKIPYYQTIVLDTLKIENSEAPIYDPNNLNIDFLKKVVDYISVPKQKLNKKCVCAIVLDVIKLLKELPTLVYLNLNPDETLTICGDIHGQFYDLLNIMNINGYPSKNNSYLFNGDFVDRGSFSVEVIIFLYLLKLTFPNNVHLTRGNHETDNMNKLYGFLGELQEKYDDKLHSLFSDSFKFLPLAYVLNKNIFICHGGIPSKTDTTLEDIEKIDRNTEPSDEGVMTDLLWSDPNEEKGFKPSKRGIGFSFGTDITENFLKKNNLSLIIRSHEVRDEGYSIEQNGLLYTVFSAPNYCDIMKNKGAFLKFKGNSIKPECVTFTEVKHPDVPSLKYAHNIYQNI